VDRRIFTGHPDVNGKVVLSQDFTGSIFGADDLCDHGTHVAGTVAALTNNGRGVAGVGSVNLMNVKVLGDDGNGSSATIDQGIMFAADQGAKVINLSLGSDLHGGCPVDQQQAVDYAWNKGSVVVAAAGNGGPDGIGDPWAYSPASCNHVLSVAATDQNDQKASFSNYNPTQVHVAAPGVSILSTLTWWSESSSSSCVIEDCYGTKDGTSMASPHVAGLAGLVWSTPFGTSNEAVVSRIKGTADPIPGTGTLWTSGRINAAAAVTPSGPSSSGLIQNLPSPQRLVDTRTAGGAIGTGSSRCFPVAGLAGIPSDAAGVVLNVTAVGYATQGWLTVYPNGQAVPATSTLNFDTTEYAMANGTIMRLGAGGQVCVSVGTVNSAPGSAHVVLDATGFLSASALTKLAMLPSPVRLSDTRTSSGPIVTGGSRCFPVAGLAGIPADAAAVVLNVTAVGYATNGWLTAFPNGQPVPATSTLNFDRSEYAMANNTLMRLGSGGQVCVNVGTVNAVPGSAHVVLDATGYLTANALAQLPMLVSPQRLVDTRTSGGPIATGTSRCFPVAGQVGIPATATGVVLNVTAVGYGTQGWLSAYPSGQAVPATSTLNFDVSEYAMANSSIVALGSNGQLCVNVGTVNSAPGTAQVVLDVVGYLIP
jgi:hypothetical protein